MAGHKKDIAKKSVFYGFRFKFIALVIFSGILLAIFKELRGENINYWYLFIYIIPYCAYCIASIKAKSIGAIIGGGSFILGVDIFIYIQVFYFPQSSTDVIAILLLPFWQCVLIMPFGFLFGWLIEKMYLRINKQIKCQ